MSKSNDELKLDINEIFGAPEIGPEPVSVPPASNNNETVSEIKFNDDVNAQVVEPMVITLQSKTNDVGYLSTSLETATPQPKETTVEPPKTKATISETSSLVVKPGSSNKTSEPQDFFKVYDHVREIFLEELKDSVGQRKTCTMLVKTFEAAREKKPEVFRNANWDSNGNLLEDGSLNIQKVLDNKNALDPQQADIILDSALVFLLNLRLQAVEKGLGFDVASKIKTHIKKWAESSIQKNGFGRDDPKIYRRLSNYLL